MKIGINDQITTKAWTWTQKGVATYNVLIVIDGDLLVGRDADTERGIARAVAAFERSLRLLITPPDAAPVPARRRAELNS